MKKFLKGLIIVLVTGVFCGACVPGPTLAKLENFKFNTPKSGETVSTSEAINCSGSYVVSQEVDLNDVHVWLLLSDEFGNYYLQNPPVKFSQVAYGKYPIYASDQAQPKSLLFRFLRQGIKLSRTKFKAINGMHFWNCLKEVKFLRLWISPHRKLFHSIKKDG